MAPTWIELAEAYAQWEQLAPQERTQPLRLRRGQGFVPPMPLVLVLSQDEWYLTLHAQRPKGQAYGRARAA